MKSIIISALIISLATVSLQAMPEGWTDDFEAAKEKAVKEGKDILVNFSGSDWCGWCKKLDGEVFSRPEFVEAAREDFVLVLIDSPRDKSVLSETAKANNPELVKEYAIRGYPTVLLMDEDGHAYTKTGYQRGGPQPYLEKLAELKAKNAAFVHKLREADKLEGVAKAKKLDEAISSLSEDVRRKKIDVIKKMLTADSDDQAGLKKKYVFYTEFLPLEENFDQKEREALADVKRPKMAAGDPEIRAKMAAHQAKIRELLEPVMREKVEALDDLLADTQFEGAKKQTVLLAYYKPYQMLGEDGKLEELMKNARDAAPDTPTAEKINKRLERMEKAKAKAEAEAEKKTEESE